MRRLQLILLDGEEGNEHEELLMTIQLNDNANIEELATAIEAIAILETSKIIAAINTAFNKFDMANAPDDATHHNGEYFFKFAPLSEKHTRTTTWIWFDGRWITTSFPNDRQLTRL